VKNDEERDEYEEIALFVSEARAASEVQRCHTFHTHRPYSVGQHSYNAAMLALSLKADGECSMPAADIEQAVMMLLVHDIPEIYTGDVPGNVKWLNPVLAAVLSEAEYAWVERAVPKELHHLFYKFLDADMPEDIAARLSAIHALVKWCDVMELWLFLNEELEVGNRHTRVIACIAACEAWMCDAERSAFCKKTFPLLYPTFAGDSNDR